MSSNVIYPAQPDKILKALGGVWTSLGREEKEQGKPTVLRACAMNLLVVTDESDVDRGSVSQAVTELMHEHPSRAITIHIVPTAEAELKSHGLEARVLALCWKPFGKAQQICCEQIEITATPENWSSVRSTVVGITVADLPVVLWCRQQTALDPNASQEQKAGWESLVHLAQKVIVDTRGLDVSKAFPVIESWSSSGLVVSDLEWTRLTPWRESLANVFDEPSRRSAAFTFNKVDIRHGGVTPGAGVLYMGGWLASQLKAEIKYTADPSAQPGLQKVTLHSDAEAVDLERSGDDCLLVRVGSRERRYNISESTLYSLLTEELSVLSFDPTYTAAFEQVLKSVSKS